MPVTAQPEPLYSRGNAQIRTLRIEYCRACFFGRMAFSDSTTSDPTALAYSTWKVEGRVHKPTKY